MKRHRTMVIASVVSIAFAASEQTATAQRVNGNAYQNHGSNPSAAANAGRPAAGQVENLPAGGRPRQGQPSTEYYPNRFVEEGYSPHEVYPDGAWQDDQWSYDSCGSGIDHGAPCSSGQFFFTADYLRVRASFSESLAFVDQDITTFPVTTIDHHQLDFDHRSSYRLGGGYRLCGCGEEIRFLHTRLRSSGADEVPFGFLIPFEPPQVPGGRVVIDADVDVKSYDLEWAKTIPLGVATCCDCGDSCTDGCGDCCPPPCPTWDVTWSGGIRYAEADWRRSFTSLDAGNGLVGDAVSMMDFKGFGAKVGLEGRRYFGHNGWFSTYLKGDISLLWGELDFQTVRTVDGGTAPDIVIAVSNKVRQIIPVTELEAGVTGQVTRNSRISAGYLLSAWHDLGFRDDFLIDPVFPLHYDDANILGFDGWFVRAEIAY